MRALTLLHCCTCGFNPLYTGKPLNRYLYSEHPDEMPHYAAFHQDLHCLYLLKKIFRQKFTYFFFEKYNLTPLDMYNGLSKVKFIVSNQKEESISIQKVKECDKYHYHMSLPKQIFNLYHDCDILLKIV